MSKLDSVDNIERKRRQKKTDHKNHCVLIKYYAAGEILSRNTCRKFSFKILKLTTRTENAYNNRKYSIPIL